MNKERLEYLINEMYYNYLEQDEAKELIDYILNLQQELTDYKKKVEMYENPDDLTLFYMWLDEKAKDKIKELTDYKERNEKAIDFVKRMPAPANYKKWLLEILDKKDKE